MTKIRILPARFDQIDAIKSRTRTTLDTHRAWHPYAFPDGFFEDYVEPLLDQSFLIKGEQQPQSTTLFTADIDGQMAGHILLSRTFSHETKEILGFEPTQAGIEDIFVAPEFRGMGVGDRLLEFAKDLAERKDLDNLTATVWANNQHSLALFERAGFSHMATKVRFGPRRLAKRIPIAPNPTHPLKWRSIATSVFIWMRNALAVIGATTLFWILMWATMR